MLTEINTIGNTTQHGAMITIFIVVLTVAARRQTIPNVSLQISND